MFEYAGDAELVTTISAETRAAVIADARRFAAIAELAHRRLDDDSERDYWACDSWDAAAAEIAAASGGITRRAASRDMCIGLALRDRLPKINARYTDGQISSRVVATITWRTRLVDSQAALDAIDGELADKAHTFGGLSDYRLEQAIDQAVDTHDPRARVRTQNSARDRDVVIGDREDTAGTTSVRGRLTVSDAALLKKRLAEMISGVCADDPRTKGQRRADALGVLAAGGTQLPCRCGDPTCPAAVDDARATSIVIHVLTDAATLDAQPDPKMDGENRYLIAESRAPEPDSPAPTSDPVEPASAPEPDQPEPDQPEPAPAPEPNQPESAPAKQPAPPNTPRPKSLPPALIVGGGILPAPLLAELIRAGARVRPLRLPGPDAEDRYRPSTALADFVRMRDLTCRFPGCNRPAEYTDIDHTTPYPFGPTHPSNNACLCRHHHLLKTFWLGWTGRQFPDGTLIWTAPTGHTYVTHPSSRLFFPGWDTRTAELPTPAGDVPKAAGRSLMMPRRRRTRTQDRAQRRTAERALNERIRPPPTAGDG